MVLAGVQGVGQSWGVLGTAFSHSEGGKVPWVAVESRGPGNTLREIYLPLARQPYMCVCAVWHVQQTGCLLASADKRLYTYI